MTIKIVKFLFLAYRLIFASRLPVCRYQPTCSRYTLEAIEKYGAFKGSYFSIKRLLSCHPLSSRPIYDPI